MDLPLLSEFYSQDPFASPVVMNHAHGFPQVNINQPYFNNPRSVENDFPPLTSMSSTLPSLDVPPYPQNQLVCGLCKGQKYSFTAYFHNTKIFAEPPHELLPWVERSYTLKNQLQSLLVTYAQQEIDSGHVRDIELEINNWGLQVGSLANEVGCCGRGSERVVNEVGEVHLWTKVMMDQLWQHVRGAQILPMPKGRVKELVLGFRKLWERVWIACAEHRLLVPQAREGEVVLSW